MTRRRSAFERLRTDEKLRETYAQLLSGELTIPGMLARLDEIEQRIKKLKQVQAREGGNNAPFICE